MATASVKELTIERPDPSIELKSRIRELENSIARFRDAIEQLRYNKEKYAGLIRGYTMVGTTLTELHKNNKTDEFVSDAVYATINVTNSRLQNAECSLRDADCDILRHSETVRARETELTHTQMELAALPPPPPPIVITQKSLKAELKPFTQVRDIRLKANNTIEFTCKNLVLTPSFNNNHAPKWIKNIDGGPFRLQIPPIRVVLDLTSNAVRFHMIRSHTSQYPWGMHGRRVAHPHVLRYHSPCLGDWAIPVTEAMQNLDFPTLVSMILNVLQTAYDGDVAGRSWRTYLTPWTVVNLYQPRCQYNYSKYLFFLCNNDGVVTRLENNHDTWPDIVIKPVTAATEPEPELPETAEIDIIEDEGPLAPENAYDDNGYDADGYDINGFDRDGYDRDGFNRDGFNDDGYDGNGFDQDGYDEDGFNRYGFNDDGYDRDGYDETGYDPDGYNRYGYTAEGYTRNGTYNRQFDTREAA